LGKCKNCKKSLKNKFDSNVDSLENLHLRDADHQVEIRSYNDKINYAAQHIDTLENQLGEIKIENENLKKFM